MSSIFKTLSHVFKIDAVLLNTAVLAIVNAIGIMYIKKINPNKDADRYYHLKEPGKYIVFNMAYTILLLSMAINARYVLGHCLKNAFGYAKRRVLK